MDTQPVWTDADGWAYPSGGWYRWGQRGDKWVVQIATMEPGWADAFTCDDRETARRYATDPAFRRLQSHTVDTDTPHGTH